ncbi:hypothetical protein B0H19DRAFT_1080733 [Mycena capillaripes]|nr:hypothetical protein B0H19DRAFT_1080733 [Mycena capillaripes]
MGNTQACMILFPTALADHCRKVAEGNNPLVQADVRRVSYCQRPWFTGHAFVLVDLCDPNAPDNIVGCSMLERRMNGRGLFGWTHVFFTADADDRAGMGATHEELAGPATGYRVLFTVDLDLADPRPKPQELLAIMGHLRTMRPKYNLITSNCHLVASVVCEVLRQRYRGRQEPELASRPIAGAGIGFQAAVDAVVSSYDSACSDVQALVDQYLMIMRLKQAPFQRCVELSAQVDRLERENARQKRAIALLTGERELA